MSLRVRDGRHNKIQIHSWSFLHSARHLGSSRPVVYPFLSYSIVLIFLFERHSSLNAPISVCCGIHFFLRNLSLRRWHIFQIISGRHHVAFIRLCPRWQWGCPSHPLTSAKIFMCSYYLHCGSDSGFLCLSGICRFFWKSGKRFRHNRLLFV